MARGWESKAVEDQMEEAARRRPGSGPQPDALTPEVLERRRRREALRLSRSQVVEQMGRARSEAHRRQLQHSLEELEAQLSALD